jgi:hypothetical protein
MKINITLISNNNIKNLKHQIVKQNPINFLIPYTTYNKVA